MAEKRDELDCLLECLRTELYSADLTTAGDIHNTLIWLLGFIDDQGHLSERLELSFANFLYASADLCALLESGVDAGHTQGAALARLDELRAVIASRDEEFEDGAEQISVPQRRLHS